MTHNKEAAYRVLVVDDSSQMREIVKRFIKSCPLDWNVEILEASTGSEAALLLQESELDGNTIGLVVLDWMMPKMSGLEFLKMIRGSETFKDRPNVIMLTAETYPEQIEACMMYGVRTYLTKPFTEEELHLALKSIVDKKEFANAV